MHSRRKFGVNVLRVAGALGLRTIGVKSVLGAGVLTGCTDSGSASHLDTAAPLPDATRPLGEDAGVASAADGGPEDARVTSVSDAGSDAAAQKPQSNGTVKSPRVIVVGSGYGSAVTALRLTERGIPVTMIEMGRMWDTPGPDGKIFCTPFNPDARAMWFRNRTEAVVKQVGPISTSFDVPMAAGIIAIKGNDDMQAYVGRGVGGGSLVNLSIYVEPLREVFARRFPDVDPDGMYAIYYPRARSELQASQVPGTIAYNAEGYRYSRVGRAAAEGAGISVELCTSGYNYDYMAREIEGTVPKSAMGGEALYGNNYGKRSLDKTYLASAMGTGLLTILTMREVLAIGRAPDGEYTLKCRAIDVDGTVVAEPEMTCTHLFLGAGSFGTPELLVRARETGSLPDLNEHVGTAWGPNSDIFVGRTNPIWQPTGSTQCSVPSMSFHTRDQDDKAVFSMIIPFPAGVETFFSMNIVMTENPEAGSFVYDASTDEVRLKWDVSQNGPAVRSTKFVFDKINQAAGTDYNADVFGGREVADGSTYHPVGGCPLGKATDAYGRISAYPGLYVVDGSLIPIGIGANPSLTITALAERSIERIITEDFKNA